MRKLLRETKREIEQALVAGVVLDGYEMTGGRHIKWILRKGDATRYVIQGNSSSCHRAQKNLIQEVKRACQKLDSGES